jgi:hypothetical protein
MAFVYILRVGDEDVFKIGEAGNVGSRIKGLSTGNHHPLTEFDSIETDDASACESYLHGVLRSRRIRNGGGKEFFALTASEVEEAVRDARAYVAEHLPVKREVERLSKQESDDTVLQPGDEEWSVYGELLEVREDIYRLKVRRERLENDLKMVIGTAAGLDGLVTWKTHTLSRFDESSFKLAQPELHQVFLLESQRRTFRLM